jgi:hypothetical protein
LPHALISLPYIQGTTDIISKLLAKKIIKTIFKPYKTLKQLFRTTKDKLDPMLGPGVYQIPCSVSMFLIVTICLLSFLLNPWALSCEIRGREPIKGRDMCDLFRRDTIQLDRFERMPQGKKRFRNRRTIYPILYVAFLQEYFHNFGPCPFTILYFINYYIKPQTIAICRCVYLSMTLIAKLGIMCCGSVQGVEGAHNQRFYIG